MRSTLATYFDSFLTKYFKSKFLYKNYNLLLFRLSINISKLKLCLSLAFFCSLFFCSASHASLTDLHANGPIGVRTQNPLYLMFLGLPMESPQTLNRDQFEFTVQTTFSNVFEIDTLSAQTNYNLDMEIWRTVLSFSYGITNSLDVRLDLPFLSTSGGFLDSFIQSYHNTFGVPNGGREKTTNGLYNFNLSQGGTTLLNFKSLPIGLSDATVRFKYLISDKLNIPFKLAVSAALKVPTGVATHGFSSKRADFGISLAREKSLKRFHLATQLGYVVLGGQEKLNPILRDGFFTFGQSAEFQIIDGLAVLMELSGNTSAFKNIDAPDLKKIALDYNVGFAGHFPINHTRFDEFFYQWSFSEDILAAGPSVDFSIFFLAGLRY